MKKLLILILIILVLALTIFTIVNGLEIGNFNVWGIRTMQEENAQLDEIVTQATRLASSVFPGKVSEVNTSMKALQEQKNTYQDMVAISTTGDVQTASQLSNYTLDFLWAKIGTHATREGVSIDIALTNGTGGENVYNLKFTVNGTYVGIAEFISGIENDTNLGFKIEEFSMKPGSSENDLQATFICKDIYIKDISTTNSTTNNFGNEITENTQTEENTNTANTITNTTSTNTAKEE